MWFLKKGGFEKEDNIRYFKKFCKRVFAHILKEAVKDKTILTSFDAIYPRFPIWISFNSPDGYAFRGYFAQGGPPSKVKSLKMVATVLKNMLEAHVRIYYALKEKFQKLQNRYALPNFLYPRIGLIKNIHQYDPPQFTSVQRYLKPLNNFALGFADQVQNDAFYNFFIKGVFWVQIPFDIVSKVMKLVDKAGLLVKKDLHIADKVAELAVNLKYTNKKAIGAMDILFLSYYCNRYQFFSKQLPVTNRVLTTQSDYYHYPVGLYRAIVELYKRFVIPFEKTCNKKLPVIVGENGIATNNSLKRARFYHEYLYALMRAVKDGYPIFGYLPWSLMDNYEWPTGKEKDNRNYGIFFVSQDGKGLQLKNGAGPLKKMGNFLKKAGESSMRELLK